MDQDNIYDTTTKTLNLTQRDLRTLPTDVVEDYRLCAQHIDLSQNRISDLSWISEFVELKEVVLDNNRLCETHLRRLSRPLINVTVLMLNKNEFGDLNETIEHISRLFPNLEHLSLHGNAICPDGLGLRPFSDYVAYDATFYRSFILSALPNLKFLDHASTKTIEFSEAPPSSCRFSFLSRSKLLLIKLNFYLKSLYSNFFKAKNMRLSVGSALTNTHSSKLANEEL